MPINDLPDELLVKIMRYLGDGPFELDPYLPRDSESFESCCLVCRRWLLLAQPLVFESLAIRCFYELAQFHIIITDSKHLGPYVRDLRIHLGSCTLDLGNPTIPCALLEECLKETTELQKISLSLASNVLKPSRAGLVFDGICQLQKLEHLAIDYLDDSDDFDNSDDFDDSYDFDDSEDSDDSDRFDTPTDSTSVHLALLDLPKTIKKLELAGPTDDLIELLPKICANLSSPPLTVTPTAPNTETASFSVHAENQAHHVTGLRSLDIERSGVPIISPALGHALASTLTSFRYMNDLPSDDSDTIRFLAKTPLIEHLVLSPRRASPVMFDRLLPLTQLRSLDVRFSPYLGPADLVHFCRPLAHFLSQSPHFHTVSARMPRDDSIFISQFIEAFLASTPLTGSLSRLRKLELYTSSALSIDTFEHMCRSATMLQDVRVRLPIAPLSRVASALANLQQLVRVTLSSPNSWSNQVSWERLNGDGAIDFVSELSKTGWYK